MRHINPRAQTKRTPAPDRPAPPGPPSLTAGKKLLYSARRPPPWNSPTSTTISAATPASACNKPSPRAKPSSGPPRLHLRRHIPGFISGLISIGVPLYIVIPFCSADSNLPTVARALFILFLIPFILLGLHRLALPWIERRCRRNTIAAVTDRRCLLLYPRLFRRPGLCEWPLRYHSVDEQPDGSGDIIFITPAHTRHIETRGPNSFPDIPRVRRVQHIIDNAARAAAPSPEPDDDSGVPPPRQKLIGGIVGGTIALLIAAALAIPLAITTRSSYRIVRDYLPATATVTHVEWSEDLARAHYRFTLDGQSYTGREQTASNVGVKEVGERIDILYNPNNPAENSPRSFFDLWLLPLILGILFLVFAAFGTLSFINVRKVRRKGPPAPTLPDDDSDAPPPRRKLIGSIVGGIVALLIAIGLSIPLAITTRSSYRIICDYLPATATVTQIEWSVRHGRRGSTRVARAYYRFTLDGQSYIGREQSSSNVGVKQVGERIDILYNPNNPAENSPSAFLDLWFLPIILSIFFLLAATISILSFGTYRKKRRKDTASPRD